jgi:tetratricopeptide (TPR) repeat protein
MTDRIAQLKNMLESEPGDAFCMYGLAMEHARLGHLQEAVAWFDQTINTDPDHCYAYFHKAKCQEKAGNVEAATETLREGLERAQALGDGKAAGELEAYLDQLL